MITDLVPMSADKPLTAGPSAALPDVASNALRESEIRYRRLFEAAQDGILLINAKSGQIEDANPYLIAMLGYSHVELLGKKLWDVGAFVDIEKSTEMFQRLQVEGYVRYNDLPLRTRSGALISVEFVSNAYDCGGVRVIQCNIRNITDQRLAEEQVRKLAVAKLAAEAASTAKSAFLANMSHEIRTPLAAIMGLTYLIRRTRMTAQQTAWLAELDVAGEHLLELINAVLDLSKIEAGKLVLEVTQVNAGGIAGSVVSILSERASTKNLNLSIEAHPLPQGLMGDASRLQQALLNYAGNAVKFTAAGSVILRTLCMEETADTALIRFEVQDTGPGIAPEALARLFVPFEQVDNSIARLHGGTGLGLAIVRQLARLMGGEAGAQSTVGWGSTFWFTARLRKERRPDVAHVLTASSPEAVLARDHASARVLLVDDDPVNREIAMTILSTVFDRVDVAREGNEAVRMAGQNAYDLILMDMQMPGIGGLEATRRIRMLPGGTDSVIVALTANAFAEDKAACFEAGMDEFLGKPVRVGALFETLLRTLLCRQHRLPPRKLH
ncbi:MAG TPA: ATP-binding protein [Ideonella sp.]|uniref:PAS domain-containing hybrid sensor histidine kinase/response regulator n=1 Tax=Ideonella sp. TaxID=1929293 RepID=UPI002E35B199|nr:ATP-binding protein [Ideonella sp.]HEX5684035.1 ATP-binding protein [Ideonella sp.]